MGKSRKPTLFQDFTDPPFIDGTGHLPLTEAALLALSVALGAKDVGDWSDGEVSLCRNLPAVPPALVRQFRDRIAAGDDPLGELFCVLRPPPVRRLQGATFTPPAIVSAMLDWVSPPCPNRVVDPGLGSGRFAVAAGRRFPKACLLGIESDPLPAAIARANLAAAGLASRSRVVVGDYRYARVPAFPGKTLFIGNPPYVRHHLLDAAGKKWLVEEAARRGLTASQLAGLHVHFFLATLAKASPGDVGVFITAAEWLDVNYGSLVRELFLGALGGKQIFVIEPKAMPFPDADTTAAVTAFEVGSRPKSVRLRRIEAIDDLRNINSGRLVRRERLETERRWSHLARGCRRPPDGYIELGELCRVHRGQVTGANKVWIEGPHSSGLPQSVFFPTVTKARELFRAGVVLDDASKLRRVIDLPLELDVFDGPERRAIDRFLAMARRLGVHEMYVASNRKAWWSVGLRQPAPVLATYMARRPPAFVRNLADARHLNIAHGLYPREPLGDTILRNLVEYLSKSTRMSEGRTYAGGLTKFEPREMERIFVPAPELLAKAPHDRPPALDQGTAAGRSNGGD